METEPTMSPAIGKLAEAVSAVIGEVGTVEKSGKNTFHRYDYASDADLLRALQPLLATHGLMMAPIRIDRVDEDGPKTGKGKPQTLTHVAVTYLLAHKSGEWLHVQSRGTGIDGEDKGIFKALTGALKYAVRGAFLVPTGDDPEQDRPRQQQRQQPKPAPVRKWSNNDRAHFCARLKELELAYNDVARWTERKGWGRPSNAEKWDRKKRDNLLERLAEEGDPDGFNRTIAALAAEAKEAK